MNTYDHLFFDLDNTIWDFSTNSRLAMIQTLKQASIMERLPGFDAYFNSYEQINAALWNDYHHKRITKQKLIVERFARSLSAFDITDCNWELLNQLYLENMANQSHLFEGTKETLTNLKNKGYQMHIITNGFREVQRKKLEKCGLSEYFTKIFISEETQSVKPHREIFEYALKSTNAKKSKSVMIGDSWETDIRGAFRFGIDQIMFLNGNIEQVPIEIQKQIMGIESPVVVTKGKIKTVFINNFIELNQLL